MVAVTGAQKTVVGLLVALVLVAGGGVGWAAWHHANSGRHYPASVRDNFLVTCATTSRGNPTDSQCRCAFDYLQSRYELSEFVSLEQSVTRGDEAGAQPFLQAAAACGASLTASTTTTTAASTTSTPVRPTTTTTERTTHTSGDPVRRTTVDHPGAGLWRTAGGGSCYYALLRDGVIVEDMVAPTFYVTAGITSAEWDPSCPWKYDGFQSGD